MKEKSTRKGAITKTGLFYNPIQQTKQYAGAASVSAYIVLSPEGKHIATLHISYTRTNKVRVDIYEDEILVRQYEGPGENEPFYQYYGKREDYPFGEALDGVELNGVHLFKAGTPIDSSIVAMADREKITYLPGLDRLKALGYRVIKAI